MTRTPEKRPLLDAAEERAREIAARCRTVERACRAIGFEPDSGHELIARLVARVAGRQALKRTVAEIAADRDVGISYSYARRCLQELVEFGVITMDKGDPAPVCRRGRPVTTWLVSLQWDFICEAVAITERYEANQGGDVVNVDRIPTAAQPQSPQENSVPNTASDLMTGQCRGSDGTVTAGCRDSDEIVTAECPEQDHSLSPPLTLFPCPLPPGNQTEEEDKKLFSGEQPAADVGCPEVTREATEPTAVRLFAAMRWPEGDVETLWRAAAGFDCGLYSMSEIADAARAACLKASRSRVGYFRSVLADRRGEDLLATVRMRGGFPNKPPDRSQPMARFRQPPPPERTAINDRRNELLQQAAAL